MTLLNVNAGEEVVSIDFSVLCALPTPITSAPIDEYYSYARSLVVRSAEAEPWLLRLLLLDLISASELYFRRILASVINICPLVREHASKQVLSLGAVSYYDARDLGYGILDIAPLSGDGEIKKRTKAITGFDIKPGSPVEVALISFDKICHLRHAAIHSLGELGARNMAELRLDSLRRRCLSLNALTFQPLVVTCHNAVRAYNQFISNGILSRWIDKALLEGDWTKDKNLFAPFHALFASRIDRTADSDASVVYAQILSAINARLGR